MTPDEWLEQKAFPLLQIPVYMHGALARYIIYGLPPGGFLIAILENDLKGAVLRADTNNKEYLVEWVTFIINEIPANSQGSPEIVEAWMTSRREDSIVLAVS